MLGAQDAQIRPDGHERMAVAGGEVAPVPAADFHIAGKIGRRTLENAADHAALALRAEAVNALDHRRIAEAGERVADDFLAFKAVLVVDEARVLAAEGERRLLHAVRSGDADCFAAVGHGDLYAAVFRDALHGEYPPYITGVGNDSIIL